MAFTQVEVLEVRAWGRTVGAITQVPGGAHSAFEYDPRWREPELSPILMPSTSRQRIWTFPQLPAETFFGLPPLVAGSVPDDFGNAVINAALQREGLRPEQIRPLDRLAYVGTRAMGALTYHPAQSPAHVASAIEMAHLVEGARAAIHGSLADGERTDAITEIISVGISAGGARAKAIIALDPRTNEVRAGGIGAPPGFEQWLIKFDGIGEDRELGRGGGYGRIEYAYWLMARQAGVEMEESRLLEEGGRAHFMTRRFDRPGTEGERLHLQSLNDLLALDYRQRGMHDYLSLFDAAERLGVEAREQLFRRMALNVLGSNNDDHTKNHAFLLPEDGQWRLSPAFDVTFAWNPGGYWTSQHLLGVNGRFDGIRKSDLLAVADRFQVPAAARLLREVAEVVAAFPEFAREAGLSEARIAAIQDRLRAVRAEANVD